ncbi:MAG: 50S ribosomal protein L9 [Coxiella sp. (in: Bacteria)]|nr:MAG: 50S ribosomal protein L9 [Coxiella sp. (in: g-proteobacteria)]
MRIILQEKIANLGTVGEIVSVKPGFARNFLLPYGKALRANDANIAEFETRRVELEARAAGHVEQAQMRLEKLAALTLTVEAQASEEGRLFGSVGARDIADAATKAGIDLQKSEVKLPEGPLRAIGEFEVDVVLHSDVIGKLKVVIKAEE